MKATIESTSATVQVAKGVDTRAWEGMTEDGIPFTAYIVLCQVRSADCQKEFERDLYEHEHKKPEADTQRAIDTRMVF